MTSHEAKQDMDQELSLQQLAAVQAFVHPYNVAPGMCEASISDHNQSDHAVASILAKERSQTPAIDNRQQEQQQQGRGEVQEDEDLFGEKDSPLPEAETNTSQQPDTSLPKNNSTGNSSERLDFHGDQTAPVVGARTSHESGDQLGSNDQQPKPLDQIRSHDHAATQVPSDQLQEMQENEQAYDPEGFIPLEEPATDELATNEHSQLCDEKNTEQQGKLQIDQGLDQLDQHNKDQQQQQQEQHALQPTESRAEQQNIDNGSMDDQARNDGYPERIEVDGEEERDEFAGDREGDGATRHDRRDGGSTPARYETEEPLIWEDATEDPDLDMRDTNKREYHQHDDVNQEDQGHESHHDQVEDAGQQGHFDGYALADEHADEITQHTELSHVADEVSVKLQRGVPDHTQSNPTEQDATVGNAKPADSLSSKQPTLADAIAAGDAAIRSSSKATGAKESVEAQKRKRSPIRYDLDKSPHTDKREKGSGSVRSEDRDQGRARASNDHAVDRTRTSDRVQMAINNHDKKVERTKPADKQEARSSDRSVDRLRDPLAARQAIKQADRSTEKQVDRATDRPSRKASSPTIPRDARPTSRPARSPVRRRSRSHSPAKQQPRSTTAAPERPERLPARRSRSPDRRASQTASRPAQARDKPVSPSNRNKQLPRDSYTRSYEHAQAYDRTDSRASTAELQRRSHGQQSVREPPSPLARKPQQLREPMSMSRGLKSDRPGYDEALPWHLIDERLADPVDYDPRMLSGEPMYRGRLDDRSSHPLPRPMQREPHPASMHLDYHQDYDDYPPARMRLDDPYDHPQRQYHRMDLPPPSMRRFSRSPTYRGMPPHHPDDGPPSPRGEYRHPPPRQLQPARHDPYEPTGGRYHDPDLPHYDLDDRSMRRSPGPGRLRQPYGSDDYGYDRPMYDDRSSRDRGRDAGRPAAREPDARSLPQSRDMSSKPTGPSVRADGGPRGRAPATREAARATSPPQRRLSRDRNDPRDRDDKPIPESPRIASKQYSSADDRGKGYAQQDPRGRVSSPRAPSGRPADNSRSRPEENRSRDVVAARPLSIDRAYRREGFSRDAGDARGGYQKSTGYDSRAAGRDAPMSDTAVRRGRDGPYPDAELPPAKRVARDVSRDHTAPAAPARHGNASIDQGRSGGPPGKAPTNTTAKAPLPPHPVARSSDSSMQMPLASKTESRPTGFAGVGSYQAGAANPSTPSSNRQNWALPNNASAAHTNLQQNQMSGQASAIYNSQANANNLSNVGAAGAQANVLAANAAALLQSLPAPQAAALLQAAVESGSTMLLSGQGMAGRLMSNANALTALQSGTGLMSGNAVYGSSIQQQQPAVSQQQQQQQNPMRGMAGQNMGSQNLPGNGVSGGVSNVASGGFGYASNMINNNMTAGSMQNSTPQLPHGFSAPAANTARAVDETSNIWFYLDPDNVQQGPCSIQQFKMWLGTMRSQPSLAQQLHQFEMALTWSTQDPRRRPLWQIVKEFS